MKLQQQIHQKLEAVILKELPALRGSFGPPMRPKNKSCFLPIPSCWFIRTIAQVLKSLINSNFTVVMVTKIAAKIG